ncbi:unnamed protein product [Didymodactylos carnosus]|uniref:Uncharacterized protein n=1 Tax=Didymodactylos carnosus TaxID=1234261 RepID=A0A813XUS2_9BILA|nr:unnamed protein product [Didymodactylos carnosus]CAF0872179.1 unnamed protein product [Didymodactylos carnosus]CAF3536675.1 unnamed protein product [Didymodactylos carnosus]CAF3659450.1 unnamed protein product [Didymodactylos carnosus]
MTKNLRARDESITANQLSTNSSPSVMMPSQNRCLKITKPHSHHQPPPQQQQQQQHKKMKVSHSNLNMINNNNHNQLNGNVRSSLHPLQENMSRTSRIDPSLRCPLRQTLPIFKQPVTYYPLQRDEVKPQVARSDHQQSGGSKTSEKTKPRQLFWEKRFQNIRPSDIDGEPLCDFRLPEQIKGIGLDMSPETVVISLATSLHLYCNSRALYGQSKQCTKNPTVFINRDQPLIEVLFVYIQITISDDHIHAQENKVLELRRKVQKAMLEIGTINDVKPEA